MRDKLRSNPVRAAGGITAALTAFLVGLAEWGVTVVPIPEGLVGTGEPFAIAVAVFLGERIGRTVQKRWTLPKPEQGHA